MKIKVPVLGIRLCELNISLPKFKRKKTMSDELAGTRSMIMHLEERLDNLSKSTSCSFDAKYVDLLLEDNKKMQDRVDKLQEGIVSLANTVIDMEQRISQMEK